MDLSIFAVILMISRPALCLDPFNYGAFTQTAAYSIANQLGFYEAVNLNVTYLQIPNSTYGYNAVLSGAYDILTGTIDNVVNLRFNAGQNLTVLGQEDAGPDLVIGGAAGITDIQQLRGKPIIVDSPVSGYAYLLRKILSVHGLRLERGDYFFQTVGSTNIRYEYLRAGFLPNGTAVVATVLTYPFTALAVADGLNILARAADYVEPFASTAYTAAQSGVSSSPDSSRRDAIRRFLAASYFANRYLADAANRRCVVEALARQYGVTAALAEADYAAVTDAVTGEAPFAGARLDVSRQGLLNVIDVRGQFGGFAAIDDGAGFDFNAAIAPGKGKMIDYTIRDEVLSGSWAELEGLLAKGPGLCDLA